MLCEVLPYIVSLISDQEICARSRCLWPQEFDDFLSNKELPLETFRILKMEAGCESPLSRKRGAFQDRMSEYFVNLA